MTRVGLSPLRRDERTFFEQERIEREAFEQQCRMAFQRLVDDIDEQMRRYVQSCLCR